MGLFWSSTKPNVSKTEFEEEVATFMSARGWNEYDRDKVKMVFYGHLHESDSQAGIDRKEIKEGIKVLKKNGGISGERLKELEKFMMKLAR